jgi:hypothetical protein
MQKITACLETDNTPDAKIGTKPLPTIEFVYGLGSSGLTPFEFAIAEKTVGDEIHLQLHQSQMPAFFGHIRFPAVPTFGESDSIVLKVRILDIAPASSREVIKTLAAIANCGESCCGHH